MTTDKRWVFFLGLWSAAAFAQTPTSGLPPAQRLDQLGGASAIVFILIAAFAIDRIVKAVLFLFSFVRPTAAGGADEHADERKDKLIYFFLVGVLAVVLLMTVKLRVLSAMRIPVDPLVDDLLTGIVLIGGADSIAGLLKPPGADQAREKPQPIEITGTLTLDDETKKKLIGKQTSA
jgi:hypothetical protein